MTKDFQNKCLRMSSFYPYNSWYMRLFDMVCLEKPDLKSFIGKYSVPYNESPSSSMILCRVKNCTIVKHTLNETNKKIDRLFAVVVVRNGIDGTDYREGD